MQKKKNRNITREDVLATKTVSFEERKKLIVIHPNYMAVRQTEIKIEKYILVAFEKAKNNSNMLLREAFEKEIKAFDKHQYYEIMKYIDYMLDRLAIYNKYIYYIRQSRKFHYENRYDDIIEFNDLSDEEVDELFRLYNVKLEANHSIKNPHR